MKQLARLTLEADEVIDLLRSLRRTGERKSSEIGDIVAAYFRDRDSHEALSRIELLERSRDRLATVLDVRPSKEYDIGHIPGALNVPLAEIERWLEDLPNAKEIIAYGRGEYCVLVYEAVATLREKGFTARRLEEGLPEWKVAGLPVERAAP